MLAASAEADIRNLIAGKADAAALTGYLPVAALPAALQGLADAPAWVTALGLFPPQNYDAYGSGGTGYILTAVQSLVAFSATNPTITIGVAGKYRMSGRGVLMYSAATFAANRTATLKLRKTSGTATDIANAAVSMVTGVTSLLTGPLGFMITPSVVVDCQAGDVISMFGGLDTVPTLGNWLVTQASVNAQRVG